MPVAGSGHLAYDAGLLLISYLQVIRARAEPSQRLNLDLKSLQSKGSAKENELSCQAGHARHSLGEGGTRRSCSCLIIHSKQQTIIYKMTPLQIHHSPTGQRNNLLNR